MIKAIGGVFLYSSDPAGLASWYQKYLGIQYEHNKEYDVWYCTLPYIDKDSGKETYQVWSVMRLRADEVRGNTVTINLRAVNLDNFITTIREQGIEVEGPEKHEQGLFAWITDPSGNRIELWEDSQLL